MKDYKIFFLKPYIFPFPVIYHVRGMKASRRTFECDVPAGSDLYVKEIAADEHFILSDAEYFVAFAYEPSDAEKSGGGKQCD